MAVWSGNSDSHDVFDLKIVDGSLEFDTTWTGIFGGANISLVVDATFAIYGDFKLWNVKINGREYPLQGSTYDISGNGDHGVDNDMRYTTQNKYHYNAINGCDKF